MPIFRDTNFAICQINRIYHTLWALGTRSLNSLNWKNYSCTQPGREEHNLSVVRVEFRTNAHSNALDLAYLGEKPSDKATQYIYMAATSAWWYFNLDFS